MSPDSHTNQLLGYPADARLLIINADDFGMCQAVNEAIVGTLQAGIVRSTTLMAPCPWAWHAMHFLADHPEVAFGVHLTAVAEWPNYRWGPVTAWDKVPSLVNKDGHFYNFEQMPEFLAQVSLAELEMEFRAQIEVVLAAGLQPTHLDWHALRLGGREDILALMLGLGREYGLALRVMGQSWIARVQSQGLPTNDYDFLDSYLLDPATKAARFVELLRALPAGLSEWAVHPGLNNAELRAIDPGGSQYRQADSDFFSSPQAQDVIREEGIILLNYRALQKVWQEKLARKFEKRSLS
ncbi:MAG: polysaccharide deacetylase family protein [Anaerolineaceae bacterium]|nr:polysaccharide deacetylase family protein [Anaerolineaceae bacterium]